MSLYQRMAQGMANARARRREDATKQGKLFDGLTERELRKLILTEPYDCPCCGERGGPGGHACKGPDKCTRCPGPRCGRVEFDMEPCGFRPGPLGTG